MAWKVKKEMPMGRLMMGTVSWKPSRFRLVSTKVRYLKIKRMDRLQMTAMVTGSRRLRPWFFQAATHRPNR